MLSELTRETLLLSETRLEHERMQRKCDAEISIMKNHLDKVSNRLKKGDRLIAFTNAIKHTVHQMVKQHRHDVGASQRDVAQGT